MLIRINISRTVKGIHPMIPAGVEPWSMGKVFFGIEILLKLANLICHV
jgi:hypothetical protein